MWGGAEMSLHFTKAMRRLLALFQTSHPPPNEQAPSHGCTETIITNQVEVSF